MSLSCSDICEELTSRLMMADFDIDVNSERLDDVWAALFDAIILKPPVKVWTAHVDHKHGVNAYVAMSIEGLYGKLYEYVTEWWCEVEGEIEAGEIVPIPEDHKAAVELYFEFHPNEYLSIEDTELLP